jgi:peptide-methionine (S)-S-oxide reductase
MFKLTAPRIASPLLHLALAASVALGLPALTQAADPPATVQTGTLQTAVLSGGCFWGMQGLFEHVKGVRKVVAGYSGGDRSTAHYGTVGLGKSGHAESVEITFDPAVVSYADVLRVFFSVAHDPTELNQQGPDEGTQYRSEIWFADESQHQTALAYIAQLQQAHVFKRPIVTRVDPLKGFYPAEGYHQDFLVKNPRYPYIVINDLPKIANLQRELPALYADQPVLLAAAAH